MLSFPRVQPSASRVRAPALNSRQSAKAHRPAAASPSTSDASVSAYDRDVLIVGPGVLGSRIASEWLERYPSAVVVGQTNTERFARDVASRRGDGEGRRIFRAMIRARGGRSPTSSSAHRRVGARITRENFATRSSTGTDAEPLSFELERRVQE